MMAGVNAGQFERIDLGKIDAPTTITKNSNSGFEPRENIQSNDIHYLERVIIRKKVYSLVYNVRWFSLSIVQAYESSYRLRALFHGGTGPLHHHDVSQQETKALTSRRS